MQVRFSRRFLAALTVPLLVLAACGSDDDDGAGTDTAAETATPETDAAETATPETAVAETAAADTTAASGTTASAGTEADGTTAAPSAPASEPAGTDAVGGGEPVTLRLGYFPNVTHAPAIIGVEEGTFQEALGDNVTIELTTFNSGTEAIEALFADAIDMSFIGPNPAINGYSQSDGEALRIVAGTTSGGASLVVREGIDSPEDLAGTTIASPSLGNTQDVALRAWLAEQGYETDTAGGGEVNVTPQDNPDTLAAMQSGDLDGAWVPEPWATRLVLEGGGHVLVDESELWPDGQFVTTHLISATGFLEDHPDVVRDLITGLGLAIDEANDDLERAQTLVNDGIERVTTSRLADQTIAGAWENLEFTLDPSPRRCRARPTTPSPSACSTTSTSPTPASTPSTSSTRCGPSGARTPSKDWGLMTGQRNALVPLRAVSQVVRLGTQRRRRARATSTSTCSGASSCASSAPPGAASRRSST